MFENDDSLSPSLPKRAVLGGIVFGFFLLTFSTYGSSLNNKFVQWDDGLLIYENPIVREMSPRSIKVAFSSYDPELYIPLTILSYQIDYLIGGTDPFIYHLGNLFLHTLNALLVSLFLYLLTRKLWVSLFCGLLFAVHPLHTEAVAWASARKDVLSTFFFLSSLVSYMYYRFHVDQCHPEPGRRMTRSARIFLTSLGLFLLGLLSKVSIITLPGVLLLLDYFQERKITKEVLKEKIPFFALSLLFGIIALYGKWGVVIDATLMQKVLMACKSTIFYLQKLLVPTDLSVLYPYIWDIKLSSPDFYIPVIFILAITTGVLLSLRWTKKVFFGFAFFFLLVSPTYINFAKGENAVYFASDRYAYIASVGIIFLIVTALWNLSGLFREKRLKVMTCTMGVIFIVFSFLSYRQSMSWRDTEAIFSHVLDLYPYSYVAHNNIGGVYRRRNELDRAIEEYQAALMVREHPRSRSNLAATYRQKGQIDRAIAEYRKTMELDPDHPDSYFGLGVVYAQLGQLDSALESYRKSLELGSEHEAELHTNIGALFAAQGRLAEAITQYELAISVNPFFVQAYYNLGIATAKLGQNQKAIAAYEEAVRLRPDFIAARINLGILYYDAGDPESSAEEFQTILSIDPANAAARSALQQMGEAE